MPTDGELAGVIADNHPLAQKVVRVDAAPQRAFGSDLDRVGGNRQRSDAEPSEMRLPGHISRSKLVSELFSRRL